MFSGLLEILGIIIIGNLAVEYRETLVFTQPANVGFLVVTLRFDIGLYKKLNHSEKTRLSVLLKKID